jgi:hypothetical protein
MRSQRTTSTYLLVSIVGITSQACEHACRLSPPESGLQIKAPQKHLEEDTPASVVHLLQQRLNSPAARIRSPSEHFRSRTARAILQHEHQQAPSANKAVISEARRVQYVQGRRTGGCTVQIARERNECWSVPTESPVVSVDSALSGVCTKSVLGQSTTRTRTGGGLRYQASRLRPASSIARCWKPMAETTGPFVATIQAVVGITAQMTAAPRRAKGGAASTFGSFHPHGIQFSDSAASYALKAASHRSMTRDIRPSKASTGERSRPPITPTIYRALARQRSFSPYAENSAKFDTTHARS